MPQENKQAYLDHVREAVTLFKDHGATRMVENWGTTCRRARSPTSTARCRRRTTRRCCSAGSNGRREGVRDAGMKAMMQDERMKTLAMPFDGQRMIFGGFSPIVEKGAARRAPAMPTDSSSPCRGANRDAYIRMALNASRVFKEYGAIRVVEAGAMTCPTARSPIFGARSQRKTARPSSSAGSNGRRNRRADEAWPKLMADPRMQPDKANMPFDAQRMIYGGFATILDE